MDPIITKLTELKGVYQEKSEIAGMADNLGILGTQMDMINKTNTTKLKQQKNRG